MFYLSEWIFEKPLSPCSGSYNFSIKNVCEVLLLHWVILVQTKYKNVIFYPAVWLPFMFSLDSPFSFASWNFSSEAWIPFFFPTKMRCRIKAWLEVRSKFLCLNASNQYRFLEAKACLSAAWMLGDHMFWERTLD